MVSGLSHITLIVRDLDRMETLLTTVLEAAKVYDSGDGSHSLARERFFLIGREQPVWLAIMQGDALPAPSYNHIAFSIDDGEFDSYRARIAALGLLLREDRSRVEGEGRSLYFYDYDHHLFELHSGTLQQRLRSYREKPSARSPD